MSEEHEATTDESPPRRWGLILLLGVGGLVLLVAIASALYLFVLRDPQKALESYLKKASAFARENKHAEAIFFFRKALVLSPDDGRIRMAIARAYVLLNDIPKAISEYREYLQRKPDDTAAQLGLGQLYLSSRNVYEAERIAESILRLNPNDINALSLRARCNVLDKRLDLAAETLQSIVRLAPGFADPYIQLARVIELKDRDVKGAEEYLKRGLEANPRDARAVIALGQFYAAYNRLAEAEAVFRGAVERDPKNATARVAYAAFLAERMGRYDEGLVQYQRALDEDPKNVPALVGSVVAALSKNDFSSAMEFTRRLLKIEAARLPGLYCRGLVKLLEGKADEAIKDLLRVASEDPNHARAQYLLGLAYATKNDLKEAKARLVRARQIDPTFTAAQLVLAEIVMAAGSPAEGIAEAEDILKRQANNVHALVIAGRGYLLQRSPEKAQPYFEKWAEIDKESVDARMVLAAVYRETGREVQALRAYEEIIAINPNLASPFYLLGTLYYGTQDYEKAIENYRKALEKEPGYPPAINNLAYTYAEHGGDLDEAQRLIEPVAARFPKQASIQDTFAWVLLKKNMYSESLRILEGIPREKRDERPLVAYHYGLALHRNKRDSEARVELEKVLPKMEDEAKRKEIEQILSEIRTRT